MKINKNTYESFFIDYLDGNLSDNEIKILIDFLDQNPDLENELRDLTSFTKQQNTKTSDSIQFDNSFLKRKPIFDEKESNFDELCISFYEGLLNKKEEKQLLNLTEHKADLATIFDTYALTKTKPNYSIIYPNKASLKKQKKILWKQYTAYAASIILILGFIFYIPNNKPTQSTTGTNLYTSSILKRNKATKKIIKYDSYTSLEKTREVQTFNKSSETKLNNHKDSHKTTTVSYNQKKIENIKKTNPLINSRKGKLAYSNLSKLELHLSKLFNEKNINKESFSEEINEIKHQTSTKNNTNPSNLFNKQFQLATTIEPIQYQKQILGSQPIK